MVYLRVSLTFLSAFVSLEQYISHLPQTLQNMFRSYNLFIFFHFDFDFFFLSEFYTYKAKTII